MIHEDARISLWSIPDCPNRQWTWNKAQVCQTVSFHYVFQTCVHQAYQANLSRICPLRYSYVQLRDWWEWRPDFDAVNLDIGHYMGDPRTVSGSLDSCKTLPWTATTIDRMGSRRLFHSINWNSIVLLRKVSSQFECGYLFALKLSTSFVAVSCLQLSLFSPTLLVCQPVTDICIWSITVMSY
jgi:hypothetical protein